MRAATAVCVLLTLAGIATARGDRRKRAELVIEARGHREKGELWEAEALLRAAVKDDPSAENLIELGMTSYLIASGMVNQGEGTVPGGGATIRTLLLDANRVLNRSLDAKESVAGLIYRGLVRLYLNDSLGSRMDLERALALGPRDPLALRECGREAYRLGQFGKARKLFQRLAVVQPKNAEAQLDIGKTYYRGGPSVKAAAPIIRALVLDPNLREGYGYLRGLFLNQGKFVEMARAVREVLTAHPGNVLALSNLGLALAEKGENAEAVDVFKRLLALKPGDLDALARLGWLYAFRLDRLDDGLAAFGRVLTENQEHPRTVQSMEYLMRRGIVEERFPMALRVLTVWCAADPENARAQAYRGLSLRRLGRYAEAVKAYEAARRADPMQAWIVSDAGLVHTAQGQFDEAERLFKEALEIDDEWLDAIENLGMLARLRGKNDEAAKWFERALVIALDSRPDVVAKFRRYLDLVGLEGLGD